MPRTPESENISSDIMPIDDEKENLCHVFHKSEGEAGIQEKNKKQTSKEVENNVEDSMERTYLDFLLSVRA